MKYLYLRTRIVGGVLALLAALLPISLEANNDMAFTVKITPRGVNSFDFLLQNDSREEITGMTLSMDGTDMEFAFLYPNTVTRTARVLEPEYLPGTRGVVREVWYDIPGRHVSDLTSSHRFPDSPDTRNVISGFVRAPANIADEYGQRIHGYLVPPGDGNYRFWIASDDGGVIFLNTGGDNPAGAVPIASVPGWTNREQWNKYASQRSGWISLEGGKRYYLSALQKERGGGDHLSLAWEREDHFGRRLMRGRDFRLDNDAGDVLLFNDPSSAGGESDTIRLVEIGDMVRGNSIQFRAAFTEEGNAANVLWNNGMARQNAKVTVFGADGSRGELTLSDTDYNESGREYVFKSENRPRTLTIKSEVDGDGMFVSNFVARVRSANAAPEDEPIEEYIRPGNTMTIANLSDGMKVSIQADGSIYLDEDGTFLYDSRDIPDEPDRDDLPRQRLVPTGLSVNNSPQTGDPTAFTFSMDGDTEIMLRWRHEYALTVDHNFDNTESEERTPAGEAWAGPLASRAAGNPSPDTTKIHWFPRGDEVIAQIDGQVLDFSRPGLDIRYVPTGYISTGSARGVYREFTTHTNDFTVGQSPPQRQQVNSFAMNAPGSIEYQWQIQFGVKVNIDDPSRAALPRVFGTALDGTPNAEVGSLEGTFWFNPGASVQVASAANVAGPTSLALNGWISGDGFYFGSSGSIDSQSGELLEGFPSTREDGSLVAEWNTSFVDPNGRLYRGLTIPSLQRPARVLWTYGNQIYQDTVTIGEYVFQNQEDLLAATPELANEILHEPDLIQLIDVTGAVTEVAESEMAIWDSEAKRLYPLVPGSFRAAWNRPGGASVQVIVTVEKPERPHYPHIAQSPPVQLTTDPNGFFFFRQIGYTENDAAISEGSLFTAERPGDTVLVFSELRQIGRGQPREFIRVRMVRTKDWDDNQAPEAEAIIGQAITDSELDGAGLETGYLRFEHARYNAGIYDRSALDGMVARDIYDMDLLRSTEAQRVVVRRDALPGPIIPVNLHPGAAANERIVVVWYYDPTLTDEILWPHRARTYKPRWPVNAAEGLGRIVIASQFGSESVGEDGEDQIVAPAMSLVVPDGEGGVITNHYPAVTTYDPSRIQQPSIYIQNNPDLPGYNPNEEHALMAPSRRFAQVSPRPVAAYALRDRDLNRYNAASMIEANQPPNYTSHPFVLTEFFDTVADAFRMRVYRVVKEDHDLPGYAFANQTLVTVPPGARQVAASSQRLVQEPYVRMEAGEPVIPFYPLGVVIGASPAPETFGINIKDQSTYWEDHKGTSWAVSGGENAWFTFSIYYPLSPSFWWPTGESGRVVYNPSNGERLAAVPNVGDSISFMPENIASLRNVTPGSPVTAGVQERALPNKILYKSDWPAVAPVLKAGETLTFSGGEYRQDNPNMQVLDANGDVQTLPTPGLPGVLGFAVGEVVFDALNPRAETALLEDSWTARMAQVLDVRSVVLPIGSFPTPLLPASGRTRISGGKYVFNDLPASLQRRFRYDPLAQSFDPVTGLLVSGRLEFIGLVNDKDIGSTTLTAPPPQVYVLEPNIMTEEERDALLSLASDEAEEWVQAVETLYHLSRNPEELETSSGQVITGQYLVGLQQKVERDPITFQPLLEPIEPGSDVLVPIRDPKVPEPARQFGPGLALVPNAGFLDPFGEIPNPDGSSTPFPDVSWVTVAENNDPSMGGSPVTLHVIRVDRRERYRGSIKTVLSDNVFDENIMMRHTGDFGGNADDLVFEWWYRPDDGALNVMPPYIVDRDSAGPWSLFPDLTGNQGAGRFGILLKGNPNAPETLLADSWWFLRYRHKNDLVQDTDWYQTQPNGDEQVNFEWAGAGNNDPFNDFNLDGFPDYRAQLSMGWIKRVLDAVNPYEARIRDFEGDSPATGSSMLRQLGPRFEGPVALNPEKDVIENVGLIELYETVLQRAMNLSINLSSPVSTPAIANALQLASTRISDFYMLLGNEAYTDAMDPTIGFGSSSVEYGAMSPVVHAFQNQMSSLLEEELALLRGVDNFFARPVYNRLFWNFTKAEGEAAYVMNYNITDVNEDGFINEDDAMILYPQGHGDAWGHYLTAVRKQYDLLRHPFFNWVSRSEFYNLMDIVIPVDFLDERKFAQAAAARARTGSEIVTATYREHYVEDPTAQWQGYTDVNPDRAWGVQGWARRAGQGSYFDWITANALLPSEHPNETLEGIQRVDRKSNSDIRVVSAQLGQVQRTFDDSNNGLNPLRLATDVVPFDINPERLVSAGTGGASHFEQIYERAVKALQNAAAIWDYANKEENRLRKVANSEAEFRNTVAQQDLAFRNRLIKIFGRPYDGTVGPGRLYPAGYSGPDLALYMYVPVRELNSDVIPGPTQDFIGFDEDGNVNAGDFYDAFRGTGSNQRDIGKIGESTRRVFASSFAPDSTGTTAVLARDEYYDVSYLDLSDPKIPLEGLAQIMPVMASGYAFQAPQAWGSRPAVGELQLLINRMVQQEAQIALAIDKWDGEADDLVRALRVANAKLYTGFNVMLANEIFDRLKYVLQNTMKTIRTAYDLAEAVGDQVSTSFEAASDSIPVVLPTGGLAVSPGDALSAARGATGVAKVSVTSGIKSGAIALKVTELLAEIALDVAETEKNLAVSRLERRQSERELLNDLEGKIGDELTARIEIFRQIEALRVLSDQYRSMVAEGARIVDERAAFNKRAAAATQMNRYQDMTFRVSRNHALENYHAAFELATRYAYMAAKAYDYETNLDANDAGSPRDMFEEIVRARTIGLMSGGQPQLGQGGLADILARLRMNYDVLKGQLGFNNPQTETGKLSLRTELFRILPTGNTQPVDDDAFPGGGENADALWRQTLQDARVENLWDVPEYRYFAKPFASDLDADGNAAVEPGIVLRFGTSILPGKNVFGQPLSGGDHSYDPSVFATKIRSVGVWFSNYLTDDVLNHLPQAPRVYLIPVGSDVMSIANSPTPDRVRFWNIVDQAIPIPFPAQSASIDQSGFIPLLDTLNGRMGNPRRFSSFRAYHDSGNTLNTGEMVFDSRLVGRSVWNTEWLLIIPGLTFNSDPDVGLDRFIDQVRDIRLVFQTYGHPGN